MAARAEQLTEQLESLASKWITVSGFPKFASQLGGEVENFISTQQFVTDTAALTAGDPALLVTQTGIVSFGSEIADIVSEFVATETDLASSDVAELESDFLAIVTSLASEFTFPSAEPSDEPSATDDSTPAPSPTSEEAPAESSVAPVVLASPGSAASLARIDLLSVSCAVAALIAAVAVAL